MRMKRTLSLTLGLILLACTLPAVLAAETAETAPAPGPFDGLTAVLGGATLNAQADVYWGYNANNPASGFTAVQPFEGHDSAFGLNLIQFQLDKGVSKESPLGFRATLAFGDAMTVVQNTLNGDGFLSTTEYLKEGYFSYMAPIGKGLQFDVGKFVTPAGFEVIETSGNWLYSRGAVFYNAIPFYHFGVRATYTLNDKWSFNGYATNGWNNVESNLNPGLSIQSRSGKTGGFSVHYTPIKQVGLHLNYLTGPQGFAYAPADWNNLVDLVVTIDPTDKLSIAGEYDFNNYRSQGNPDMNYTAAAAFARYQICPKWAVAGRYEYINNHSNGFLALSPHYQTFTGAVERKLAGHLISRLEYRHDIASQAFFAQGTGGLVSQEDTVKLGAVLVLGE